MNPVIPSLKPVLENPEYVFIDKGRIEDIAPLIAKERLDLPTWKNPVFIGGVDPKQIVDFLFLGNSINFKYWAKQNSKIKTFETYYKGIQSSASAMWGCLKRGLDNRIPILNADYLADLDRRAASQIFYGNMEIPMLDERVRILNEIGWALMEKYDGHFYNLIGASNRRPFSNGKGIVDLLIKDFPSFNDISIHKKTQTILKFYKRAQLAVGMAYERLSEKIEVKDIDDLTVFADYQLPRSLRMLGLIRYAEPLEKRILNKELIKRDSREEQEIRANTIYACHLLVKEINKHRGRKGKINALHLDYKLWSEGEFKKLREPHHLTCTTAY